MLNHSAFEAVCVATYAEDYLDFVENFPNVVQPGISNIRKLDTQYFDILKRLRQTQDKLRSETDVNQRKKLCQEIKILLAKGQFNGDEKLQELARITELIEAKIQHLDNDAKNFDPPKPQTETSSKRHMMSMAEVQSITESPDNHLTGFDEFSNQADADGYRNSPSFSGMNKRSRRKKEFPDYIRESDVVPIKREKSGSLAPPNNGNCVKEGSVASSNGTQETPGGGGGVTKKKRKKRNSEKSQKLPYDIPVDPDEPTYCLCEQVSYGEMIGCDYNGCVIEWFHFNCVGLTSKPKGKWFCPQCRGDKPTVAKASLGK